MTTCETCGKDYETPEWPWCPHGLPLGKGVAVLPAQAQALPSGVVRVQSVEGIDEYRLANGLQVVALLRWAPEAAAPTPDTLALKAWCRERLAGYKCPRSIAFIDALPLSGAGKVLKTALRDPHWQGRARGIA